MYRSILGFLWGNTQRNSFQNHFCSQHLFCMVKKKHWEHVWRTLLSFILRPTTTILYSSHSQCTQGTPLYASHRIQISLPPPPPII